MIGVGSIRKELANLDLQIILNNSLVEFNELRHEEVNGTSIEWEYRKTRRRKDFMVKCIELPKYLIWSNVEPKLMVLCLFLVLPSEFGELSIGIILLLIYLQQVDLC